MSKPLASVFASLELVRRIEAAETRLIQAVVAAVGQSGEPIALAPFGSGVLATSRPGSPFNKLVGAGFAPFDEASFAPAEAAALTLAGNVRAEIATLADPAAVRFLLARGYRFEGYENVLGRALDDLAPLPLPPEITIRQPAATEITAWMDAVAIGFLSPDESLPGVVPEAFAREAFDRINHDMLREPSFERWIAFRAGEPAGGGSMRLDDGIAQLCGAATLPAHRRRGVQSALLQTRLHVARERGATLSVVTTEPGSKSQENAQKAGFSLLYARGIYVKE